MTQTLRDREVGDSFESRPAQPAPKPSDSRDRFLHGTPREEPPVAPQSPRRAIAGTGDRRTFERETDVKPVDTLLLSSIHDLATDLICHRLVEEGASFLRLNIEQLADLALSLDPIRARMEIRSSSGRWRISDERLRNVWWRQATFRRDALAKPMTLESQLIYSQWPAFMRGLMLFESASWYNFPAAVYKAESKPYQLRTASVLGFDIPETRITNDNSEDLPNGMVDSLVIKSVDTIHLTHGDFRHFAYANTVSWDDCSGDDFNIIPSTCQFSLQSKLDIRVTVIGNRLWSHSIECDGGGVEGDWRLLKKNEISHRPHDLPSNVKSMCLDLVTKLELRFGAIDLVLCGGKYWFLEINPTGEWAWLDSNGEMAKAITEEIMI